MRWIRAGCWLGVAVVAGCGPDVGVDAGASGSASTSTSSSTTSDTSSSSTIDPSSSSSSSTGALDTSSDGDLGCPFLCPPDLGSRELHPCDQWAQDCPSGEKCIAYAVDGEW